MDSSNVDREQLLAVVLEVCEEFFAGAGPAIHREVDVLLLARGISGGPGWLIDMLALSRVGLPSSSIQDEHG